jgi:NADH-quinone oxidoreductase subunit A
VVLTCEFKALSGLSDRESADVYSPGPAAFVVERARVTEYYREYLAVAVLFGAALLMVGGILAVGRLLRPVHPEAEKYVTYEAGSDPVGGWGQSNVRYYVYALLFVMFDVEAVFIFPWAVRLETLGVQSLISMIVFIVILALGLVYAWRKGVLRWA